MAAIKYLYEMSGMGQKISHNCHYNELSEYKRMIVKQNSINTYYLIFASGLSKENFIIDVVNYQDSPWLRVNIVESKSDNNQFYQFYNGPERFAEPIPTTCDLSEIEAECKNGILKITIPFKNIVLPKKIEVK